jgi:hypothetical protein
MDVNDAQLIIPNIIYPHAISVDLVTGGIFVRGYTNISKNNKIVYHYRIDGVMLSSFALRIPVANSSSSFSSINSESSEVVPERFIANSIVYDRVRNRIWWIDENACVVCVADENNKQVISYDLTNNGFNELKSIDIEYSTGNILVVAKKAHERYIVEMSRDNKEVLGEAYIQ